MFLMIQNVVSLSTECAKQSTATSGNKRVLLLSLGALFSLLLSGVSLDEVDGRKEGENVRNVIMNSVLDARGQFKNCRLGSR